MRQLAFMVGMLGVGLSLIGAVLAIFIGGVGLVTGGGSEAGLHLLRGLLAAAAALLGGIGAVVSLFRPRAAAGMLAASAIVGVALVGAYYVVGAILILVAAYYAFRADQKATTG